MLKVSRNRITLTRGDTAYLKLNITDESDNAYELSEGDIIFFRIAEYGTSGRLLFEKTVNIETLTLELKPEDTAGLEFRTYRYEVEVVTEAGEHFTVIENAAIEITVELERH